MDGYYLDGGLCCLGRDLPGVVDVLMLETARGKAALLFRDRALAEAQLARLPHRAGMESLGVRCVAAEDFRAKEELLRAVLAAGAALLWLDLDPGGSGPGEEHLTQRALNYVLSFKNEVSCI